VDPWRSWRRHIDPARSRYGLAAGVCFRVWRAEF
jgi:hypothetical protein